eukprot:1156777-Pelagomonas_calceolata.AAC.5
MPEPLKGATLLCGAAACGAAHVVVAPLWDQCSFDPFALARAKQQGKFWRFICRILDGFLPLRGRWPISRTFLIYKFTQGNH